MDDDRFVPKDISDLVKRLKNENLQGELSKEGEGLLWRLPNHIVLKVYINDIESKGKSSFREGYIAACYLKNGKEQYLTHWHPLVDEIYQDLTDINCGRVIWVRKRSIWGEQILIMDRKEYEALCYKKKRKYTILS